LVSFQKLILIDNIVIPDSRPVFEQNPNSSLLTTPAPPDIKSEIKVVIDIQDNGPEIKHEDTHLKEYYQSLTILPVYYFIFILGKGKLSVMMRTRMMRNL
jgi:hypothetical protein